MSYDVDVAAHTRPTRGQVEVWASDRDLVVRGEGDDGLVVERASGRGSSHVLNVDGPFPAEAEDLPEELAVACLAPRWLMTISAPYSGTKRGFDLVRSLARQLAELNQGAAFDAQEHRVLWPRSARRAPSRPSEETTSVVQLSWFVAPTRWPQAPATLLEAIGRHAAEALPRRYGQWEPPQHRFEEEGADAFVRLCLETEDLFWYSSRPSFGGSCTGPAAPYRRSSSGRSVGRLDVSFDGSVLERDERWRETVVDLFTVAARRLGAFFAAAQVEAGWTVTRANRIYATGEVDRDPAERFLQGLLWQGLPPVPVWLSWFGGPYRELVAGHVTPDAFDRAGPRRALRRRHGGMAPQVEDDGESIFVRLGAEPRPRRELPAWPLPRQLTYRRRKPRVNPLSIASNRARPGDEAAVVPPLE